MKIPKTAIFALVAAIAAIMPCDAFARTTWIDALNLAPFVPIVLDALMMVATGGYDFFVGNGNGIIYLLVWGFLIFSISVGLIKMYLPSAWISLFGFSGGGEMADGKITPTGLVQDNVLKPVVRAIIAAAVLLQLRPTYLTNWLVNPFLQFGSLYTASIMETVNTGGRGANVKCPPDIIEHGWISESSCEFLVQPVADISHANNQVIKQGFDFLSRGIRGLLVPIPHGGQDFMNVVTGIILIFTFVGSNLFMALLIIQAIFNFGMSLILYPFQVLTYVAKQNDKWFDIWPAFSGVTSALQKLIITMVSCAFILCINIAIIRAMFQWNSSIFVVAAGGTTASNMPQIANTTLGFGGHSIMWMSAILTFYLIFKIFDLTRAQLKKYVGGDTQNLYNTVKSDATRIKKMAKSAKKIKEWFKE